VALAKLLESRAQVNSTLRIDPVELEVAR